MIPASNVNHLRQSSPRFRLSHSKRIILGLHQIMEIFIHIMGYSYKCQYWLNYEPSSSLNKDLNFIKISKPGYLDLPRIFHFDL